MVFRRLGVLSLGLVLLSLGCSTPGGPAAEEEPVVHHVRVSFEGEEYEELEDVKECFEIRAFDHCLRVAQKYAGENPQDAWETGKFIRLQANHWVAVEFFETAAREGHVPEDFCEDSDLHLAIDSGLSSPDFREEVIQGAKYLLGERCWDELHEQMAEEVSGTGAFVDNFCALAREKEGRYEVCDENDAAVAEAEREAEERREAASEPREEVVTAQDLEWDPEGAKVSQVLVFENELRARVWVVPMEEDTKQVFVIVEGVEEAMQGPIGHHRFTHRVARGQQYRYVTLREGREFTTVIQDGGRARLWVPGQSSASDFFGVEVDDGEIQEALAGF